MSKSVMMQFLNPLPVLIKWSPDRGRKARQFSHDICQGFFFPAPIWRA